MSDKTYRLKLSADCVGSDGKVMFTSEVAYENLHYQDVVLLEKVIIDTFKSLNEFAEKRPDKQKNKNK